MKRAVLNKHTPLSEDIIRKLPKAELHLHLDGSVRIGTIIELAEEQVPVLDSCTRLSVSPHLTPLSLSLLGLCGATRA
jgi:hypothetical protein